MLKRIFNLSLYRELKFPYLIPASVLHGGLVKTQMLSLISAVSISADLGDVRKFASLISSKMSETVRLRITF